jgi:hypothetical protein
VSLELACIEPMDGACERARERPTGRLQGPNDGSVELRDVTEELSVGGASAFAQRIAYVGELGFELYVQPEWAVQVWDRLLAAASSTASSRPATARSTRCESCAHRRWRGVWPRRFAACTPGRAFSRISTCRAYFGRIEPALLAHMHLNAFVSDVGWTLWAAIQERISEIDFDFWGWATMRWHRAVAMMDAAEFPGLLRAVCAVE